MLNAAHHGSGRMLLHAMGTVVIKVEELGQQPRATDPARNTLALLVRSAGIMLRIVLAIRLPGDGGAGLADPAGDSFLLRVGNSPEVHHTALRVGDDLPGFAVHVEGDPLVPPTSTS
jgi:hypothetical protein